MLQQKKIVIAGGSGYIGQAMAAHWSAANEVVILTRHAADANNNSYGRHTHQRVREVRWDAQQTGSWVQELEGADMLINLTGRSVNCRYTAANKKLITASRVAATCTLAAAVRQLEHPPALWINSASATIYRHATDRPQDEFTGEIENDFSVQVCKAWEQAFMEAAVPPATRKAALRMAIVLGNGGALVPYMRMVKAGLGGRHGSGRQMFSWIHETDLCRIAAWLYDHPEQQGIYNAAAPQPVSNDYFMRLLRRYLHRPVGLPAPQWLLKAGAAVIGTEPELLLKSRWVVPARLQQQGFEFTYPSLEQALAQIIPANTEIRHV